MRAPIHQHGKPHALGSFIPASLSVVQYVLHVCVCLHTWFHAQVPLEKGYSQVDWLRVSRSAPPPKIRRDITLAEVAQHRSREDAWMVFRNRVYNITPYLRFHPGGADILMKAAGKDGTALFLKYHA